MGKVAGGMAAAGGALQAGKMAHNAIKPKEVSEYDDYDCDEGAAHVYGTALKTVSKMNPATKRKLANVAVAGTGIGAGLAMDQAGAISAMKKIKKSNESDYYDDFDEGIAGSAARAVGDTIRMASPKAKKLGAGVAALGATTGYCTAYGGKLSRKANGSNESDDYDCDEGVIGKTVKYGFAAGAALGAGKMARDAIKNRKTVSEYDDYDCDEGIGGAIKTGVTKLGSVIKSKAGAMKNSLKTDYVSKGSALKVAAGTAAAGAAGGTVAGSKLAGKRNESLAAAINGGRIPRRAKSVSVQESEEFDPYKQLMLDSIEDSEEIAFGRTFDNLIEKMQKFFEPSEIYNICLKSKLNEKDFDKPHFCRNPKSRPTIFKIDSEPEEMNISTIEFISKKCLMN